MIRIRIRIKKNKVEIIIYRLKFIDSYRFIGYSLSILVDNISEINTKEHENSFIDKKQLYNPLIETFYNTYQLSNKDINKFALLLKKGVYPYEYMDSWKRFNELIPLEEDYYYSKLYMKGITKEDIKHVPNVCDTFRIKTLGEYHDLYIQLDTVLLADVFENFRDKCMEIYKIDPAYFLSAPGLAWQACLKKTGVELDLLTDIDMLLMFEEGIRGGMCQATYRYAKANNKYMTNYDKNKESSYLQYLDANNLYGWAMSQKLPVGNFKWVEKDNALNFIKDYDINSDKGYIFEVDVEYPKNLYNLHSDLPFLPERMKINNSKKLVCSVCNKENHLIHIRALKQALDHGLKLTKVHRVIEFRQEAWLKPYIDMNTELRKHAKNESEK